MPQNSIGSPEIATKARFIAPHAPGGFRWLGAGAFRDAYLGPDGVVYKVAQGHHCVQDNRAEDEVSRAIWDAAAIPAIARLLEKVYVPKTTLYGDILAMEYVDGAKCEYEDARGWLEDDVPQEVLDALEDLGIYDCHGGNVLRTKDGYAVVDLGNSDSSVVYGLVSDGEA